MTRFLNERLISCCNMSYANSTHTRQNYTIVFSRKFNSLPCTGTQFMKSFSTSFNVMITHTTNLYFQLIQNKINLFKRLCLGVVIA